MLSGSRVRVIEMHHLIIIIKKDAYTYMYISGSPSQPKFMGAMLTNDDTALILKWRLESYSPISEYKVSCARQECVTVTYQILGRSCNEYAK